MPKSPFEIALQEARKALNEALEDRSAIEHRIVSLKQTIEGLSSLCEPESSEDLLPSAFGAPGTPATLTDAIRTVFSESTEHMLTPPEVRDALVRRGFDLRKYKQALVPIHNTLKRLQEQGELVTFVDDKGSIRGYRWVSPLARAVAEVGSQKMAPRIRPRNALFYGGGLPDVPNPFGRNLAEMLTKKDEGPKK